jgi:hypothetical protein
MRFCPWYPLALADRHAPTTAGMFQVRISDGLIDYPSGKSAMVHYQLAAELRPAIAAFRAELGRRDAGHDWLCRHTVEGPADPIAAAELHARLVRDFTARFGSAPRLP